MKAPVLPTSSTVWWWTTSHQDHLPRPRFLPTNSTFPTNSTSLPPFFLQGNTSTKGYSTPLSNNLSMAYATRIFFTISEKSNHSNKVGSLGDKVPKRRYIYPSRREGYIGRYLYGLAWRQNSCKRERGRRRDEMIKSQNKRAS